jgi:hypothetical protein
MPEELSDLERLRLIVKALTDCGQKVSRANVTVQFHHETGRWPRPDHLDKVVG